MTLREELYKIIWDSDGNHTSDKGMDALEALVLEREKAARYDLATDIMYQLDFDTDATPEERMKKVYKIANDSAFPPS